MAPVSKLKKGNIIYISVMTMLIFSLSITGLLTISIIINSRVNRIEEKSSYDRYEENLAYECYLGLNDCPYPYEINGDYITIYFNEGIKKYQLEGKNGIIIIRKVDLNE